MNRPNSRQRLASQAALAAELSFFTVLAAGAGPGTALAQAGSGASDDLQEIVVTARKKEESLLETPIAITAITAEDMEKKGITSFNQLIDATPGVNMTNLGGGGGRGDRSFQQITLRGFVPSTTLSTLTATFIDGVPVASPTAVAAVHDPARVEILKGPQAAYFGRNTFAGAVNVVNKQPGDEFGGAVSLMGGTRGNIDLQGSIEGPIAENYGFRLGAHLFQKDGSYKNAANPGQTLGDQETHTFSLFLAAKPTENFSAKLFGMYSEDDDGPSVQAILSAYEIRSLNGNPNFPFLSGNSNGALVLPSSANCTLAGRQFGDGRAVNPVVNRPFVCGAVPVMPAGFSPAQNTLEDASLARSLADPRHRPVSVSQGVDGYGLVREYEHVHLNLDYQFGDSGFAVSSLSGLNVERWSEVADLDNYDTHLFTNTANPTGSNPNLLPYWDFRFGVERETFDASQELRLSYDKEGPFSGSIGVSELKTRVWSNLLNLSQEGMTGADRAALAPFVNVGHVAVKTQSVFFGASYAFTEQLKLNLEGRYQKDEVTAFASSSPLGVTVSAAAAAQYGLPAGFYAPNAEILTVKYNNFLPRVILQYDLNPDIMVYGSYSKGVNVGTNTINTAFLSSADPLTLQAANSLGLQVVLKPEKLSNYELGLKGKFLDGRMQLQAAIYQATWSDQLNTRSQTFQHPTLGTQLVSGPANTGEADMRGVEVEMIARPTEHLELSFAAAMTDSDIQSYEAPTITQLTGIIGDAFEGKQLPLSSKYSANFGVQYGTALSMMQDATWFARADLSWKDKQFLDASNVTWIKARAVTNLRAGINKGPLALDLFVNNAFNDKNYTGIIVGSLLSPTGSPAPNGANAGLLAGLPELRTYGARLSYKF